MIASGASVSQGVQTVFSPCSRHLASKSSTKSKCDHDTLEKRIFLFQITPSCLATANTRS